MGIRTQFEENTIYGKWRYIISRDLELEDSIEMINHVKEHNHLGVMITINGNHKTDINNRINKGQAN